MYHVRCDGLVGLNINPCFIPLVLNKSADTEMAEGLITEDSHETYEGMFTLFLLHLAFNSQYVSLSFVPSVVLHCIQAPAL